MGQERDGMAGHGAHWVGGGGEGDLVQNMPVCV